MGSATCRRCQHGGETRKHIFRECPSAKETRESLGVFSPNTEASTDFNEWFKKLFQSYSLAKCRLIACTMWALWTSRNRFIHEGVSTSGSQIADYVKNSLKELDGVKTDLPARPILTDRWVAPTGPRLKINFGATFNKQRNGSCSGMVVRNEKGDVICFKIVFHSSLPSVFTAEALAGFWAIHLGLFLQLREVEIEGDSRSVICKLQEKKDDRLEIVGIIKDSKKLSYGFVFCIFHFTHRESNQVAHFITIEGLKKRENSYLANMVFSGAEDAMLADRRGLECR
ncbi:hypothetical protein PVK06_011680 [Gossypium arboreum]|uniref:RNase H type-1 domain-containing protein n=1 Tax=Gossypium arboreum TaxID=29729 RepID=A0ABR0QAA0_GOSAR|nr:hypothetical protein PVK06_011680 [Gossypium arboreum]